MIEEVLKNNAVKSAEIYLAAGCFWGTEAYFKGLPGVIDTEVGYANGKGTKTSYHELSESGHAETLKLVYDPERIHLAELLERFYRVIDPFSLNRQGHDIGTQYRTGIYYINNKDKSKISQSLECLHSRLGRESVIEFEKLQHFIPAEEYHQDYLDKNPGGYCHINTASAKLPLFEGRELPDDALLQTQLSRGTYEVMRRKGTEAPFSSELDGTDEPGIYVDAITGKPLFSSDDKYDAGCGWPSFTMPITSDAAVYLPDHSYGMDRTEVQTAEAENHLGHVFTDGPRERGGLRYCINGVSLHFIPYERMKEEGYEALMPFVTP